MANPDLIYMNGVMLPYQDATIHVSSVAAKYGANVFEGLCTYGGEDAQSFVFRIQEHIARLRRSIRLMQIECAWTDRDYLEAIVTSLEANRIRGDAHIRLTVFITGEGGCEGSGPTSLVCIAKARAPTRLDTRCTHAAVTSWRRIDDSIMPPRVKAGANYNDSRFGLLEARRNGYEEAIFLTLNGKVADGANSCFALVRDGALITPPVTSAILESVTRATLLELATDDLGLKVEEREVDRSELMIADEAFFCGTAHEIRPVLSIDRFPVREGRIGAVTRRLWDAYEGVVRGRNQARGRWLTPV
jgi:branched-chain amino acid aminotransferase